MRTRRNLVLDAAPAGALASTRARDRVRAQAVLAIAAADGRVVVPAAVRVECGWSRRDAAAADANRLVPLDDALDRVGADRAATLRVAVPSASVADAAVAVAASRCGAGVTEVLTSDVGDLTALCAHLDVPTVVVRI